MWVWTVVCGLALGHRLCELSKSLVYSCCHGWDRLQIPQNPVLEDKRLDKKYIRMYFVTNNRTNWSAASPLSLSSYWYTSNPLQTLTAAGCHPFALLSQCRSFTLAVGCGVTQNMSQEVAIVHYWFDHRWPGSLGSITNKHLNVSLNILE